MLAMARDTGARPEELLRLRIGDVKIIAGDNGRPYSEIVIGEEGKTEDSFRTVALRDSIPYIRRWLSVHPKGTDLKAYIFISIEYRARGKNVAIQEGSLADSLREEKRRFRSRVLERPDLSQEQRAVIEELLKKPWNPYWQRHFTTTELITAGMPAEEVCMYLG
jgi:hypothetical protein